MLYITVDEGYAFDFLSILDIKKIKLGKSSKTDSYWTSTYNSLCNQIGKLRVDQILSSDEYSACINANSNMFDLVDLAKSDKITARQSDEGNYARCEAKKRLQKKFFGNELTEVKVGYDTYEKED